MKDLKTIDRKLGKESQRLNEYCRNLEEKLLEEYRIKHLDDKMDEIIDAVHRNPFKNCYIISLAPNHLKLISPIILGTYTSNNSGTMKNVGIYSSIIVVCSIIFLRLLNSISSLTVFGWLLFVLSALLIPFSIFNLEYVISEILFRVKYGKIRERIRKLIQENTDLAVHYYDSSSMKISLRKK